MRPVPPSEEVPNENSAPLLRRLWIYQRERFPLLGHGLLVASFSFSAIAYSRICRGVEGFIEPAHFGVGIFSTITLFLLVRLFDEFKDAEDDARYRPHLPVPRGLVSLPELFRLGVVVVILQVGVNLYFFPAMLWLYLAIMAYLSLMGKEFFVADWLKKHQFWYVVSHMFIIPLIDLYASGLDWLLAGAPAPTGLAFFFIVSYLNGIVLEVGRKIRPAEAEAEGVLTYTALLGIPKALALWVGVLALTFAASVAAAWYAGYAQTMLLVLGGIFVGCALPAFLFWRKPAAARAKSIEYASALWTIAMYMTLGAAPMLHKLFFNA